MSSVVEELEEPPSFSSHTEFNLDSAVLASELQTLCAAVGTLAQILSNTSVAIVLMLSHTPLSVSISSVVEELEEPPNFSSHTEFNLDSAVLASELQTLCAAVGTLAQILSN